jgi:hypothetical protein
MGPINTDGLIPTLIFLIVLAVLGWWELIQWVFNDDAIRVTEPLVPELELTVKDNVIDTIYVYQKP